MNGEYYIQNEKGEIVKLDPSAYKTQSSVEKKLDEIIELLNKLIELQMMGK